jgi:hypothetical protein
MTGKVILPINYPDMAGKVIFLAGPIVGAPKWHNNTINIIKELDSKINIICPSYHCNVDEKYWKDNTNKVESTCRYKNYWPEVEWQFFYRDLAFKCGCELFWLPKEQEHNCYYPYAMTTRAELFSRFNSKGNICIGIQEYFSGGDYIKYSFEKYHPEIQISSELEKTCEIAVEIANQTKPDFEKQIK